jgi:hypothetical protein
MHQRAEKKGGNNHERNKKEDVNQQPPSRSQARLIPEEIVAKFV